MMRLTEAEGQRVLAADSATTVGRVSGIVVDPRNATVIALRVARASGGDTLHWSDIRGFGPDAVMVNTPEAVHAAAGRTAEILDGHPELAGKRLLTDGGDELGTVRDIAFDADGKVTAVDFGDGAVPGDRLLGCGAYAVVVRREARTAPTGSA